MGFTQRCYGTLRSLPAIATALALGTLVSLTACSDGALVGQYADTLKSSSGRQKTGESGPSSADASGSSADGSAVSHRNSADACDSGGAEARDDRGVGHIDTQVCSSTDNLSDKLSTTGPVKDDVAASASSTVVAGDRRTPSEQPFQISIPLLRQEGANLADLPRGDIGALIVERRKDGRFLVWLGGRASLRVSVSENRVLVKLNGPSIVQAIRFRPMAAAQLIPKIIDLDEKNARKILGSMIDNLMPPDNDECKEGDDCKDDDRLRKMSRRS